MGSVPFRVGLCPICVVCWIQWLVGSVTLTSLWRVKSLTIRSRSLTDLPVLGLGPPWLSVGKIGLCRSSSEISLIPKQRSLQICGPVFAEFARCPSERSKTGNIPPLFVGLSVLYRSQNLSPSTRGMGELAPKIWGRCLQELEALAPKIWGRCLQEFGVEPC